MTDLFDHAQPGGRAFAREPDGRMVHEGGRQIARDDTGRILTIPSPTYRARQWCRGPDRVAA